MITEIQALRDRYAAAPDYPRFLAAAAANRGLWLAIDKRSTVPAALVERARRATRVRHLLVLAADWCGDAVNTLPFVARLAEALPGVDLKVLDRDENPDIMDRHLTGASRSIPVVILLDENFVEIGWWGPRPAALQEWVLREGLQMSKDERYKEVRRWYVRDGGLRILTEIVDRMEKTG